VEAMTMATRIAIMHEGRLQQVGRPQDVYDRPANLFVARFIGSPPMNTLAGHLDGDVTRPTVRIGEADIPVRVPAAALPAHGSAVTVGVRPEHLHLADRMPPGPAPDTIGNLPATVRAVEWLGHERHLVCDVGGSSLVLREPAEGTPPAPGDVLKLATAAEHVHLFDDTTADRID
jgi:multiple sugar transport system ATP-binding protein